MDNIQEILREMSSDELHDFMSLAGQSANNAATDYVENFFRNLHSEAEMIYLEIAA